MPQATTIILACTQFLPAVNTYVSSLLSSKSPDLSPETLATTMTAQNSTTGPAVSKGSISPSINYSSALSKRPKTSKSIGSPKPVTGGDSTLRPIHREKAERAAEWLMPQERDYRSLVVSEYDAHQEAERERHRKQLEKILNATY